MNKKRALGKGLEAFFPSVKSEEENIYKVIDIDKVQPNKEQPRQLIDSGKLEELAESIKEHGIIQPIVVRPMEENNFQIIAGERRWRACKKLGMKVIPALVKNYEDLEATAVALIENVQRENLNPLEEAWAYKRLMGEFNLTQEEVSRRVGKSRPFVGNMVRLLSLGQGVREMLKRREITAGHARALLGIDDEEKQLLLAKKIMEKQLNVRQAEDLVSATQAVKPHREKGVRPVPRAQIRKLERDLGSLLSTNVKIRVDASGQGKIAIIFNNVEEFNSVVGALSGRKDD